jgi:hypothetical protein
MMNTEDKRELQVHVGDTFEDMDRRSWMRGIAQSTAS